MSFGFGGSGSSTESQNITSNLYNQNGTSSGTTTRVLTPEQLAAQTQLTQIIHALATNPDQFLAPAKNKARNDVNDNYAGLADSLRQQFMATPGGGATGKYGAAALPADLSRRKALSDVDTSFDVARSSAPLTAAQLSQQLLGMNFGQTSTGATTNTGGSTGVATGTGSTKEFKGSFGL
jgi:hypothetical protein